MYSHSQGLVVLRRKIQKCAHVSVLKNLTIRGLLRKNILYCTTIRIFFVTCASISLGSFYRAIKLGFL